MAAPAGYRPWRYLGLLAALVVALTVWAFWPGQAHTPQLGLDLRGGTQVILDPQPITEGAQVTEEQLQQSVEIIRARVNGIGVAEADVSIQGSGNDAVIVVSVPGVTQDRIVELVGRTALLNFRPVKNILNPAPGDASAQQPTDSGTSTTKKDKKAADKKSANANAETPTDQPDRGSRSCRATPTTPSTRRNLLALDCTKPENQSGGAADDPTEVARAPVTRTEAPSTTSNPPSSRARTSPRRRRNCRNREPAAGWSPWTSTARARASSPRSRRSCRRSPRPPTSSPSSWTASWSPRRRSRNRSWVDRPRSRATSPPKRPTTWPTC